MAPQSMGTGGAATGGLGLPSLTEQLGGAGAGGASTIGGAGTAAMPGGVPAGAGAEQGAAQPAANPMAGITGLASQGRWLGPIMAIGGGAAAIKGFSAAAAASAGAAATKAPGLLKWGGLAAALGGVALTGIGFKAKGIEVGTKATEAQATASLNQLATQAETVLTQQQSRIMTLEQQLALAQQGGAGAGGTGGTGATGQVDPTTGQPVPGAGGTTGGVGVGLDGTVVPGGQATGTGAPGATTPGPTTAGTTGTTGTAGVGAGQWSPQALVGRTVQLQAGASASGTVIADPGSYRIEQLAGDPNGYASADEANAAARASMSTELMGSKFLRWMVVEHGGRFYGVVAKQQGQQDQPNPLSADMGTVVAWSAMNHVTDNGQNGWQAYTWSQAGGAQSFAVPYGTTSVFGSGAIGAGPAPGAATGTAPATGGVDQPTATGVTGGGAVTRSASAAFDPASQVGRSFSVNASTTAEGDLARGGALQVQRFVETSTGGFGTAEEAAAAARSARQQAGGGDQWKRWVTLQGDDGRFYVYEGSIVKRETAPLQGASPLHVFGAGFAEYFDGSTSSWKAVRDAQ